MKQTCLPSEVFYLFFNSTNDPTVLINQLKWCCSLGKGLITFYSILRFPQISPNVTKNKLRFHVAEQCWIFHLNTTESEISKKPSQVKCSQKQRQKSTSVQETSLLQMQSMKTCMRGRRGVWTALCVCACVGVGMCLCIAERLRVHVHGEAEGHPQVSFLGCFHLCSLRQDLSLT